MIQKPTPLNEEYHFKKGLIISSTDLEGIITYANRKFCDISGYDRNELIGRNHHILRHPDMPKSIFKSLWTSLNQAEEWTGVIKNLRKDGKYYWVYSYITPNMNDHGKVIGYTAARRPASKTEIDESVSIYAELSTQENTTE